MTVPLRVLCRNHANQFVDPMMLLSYIPRDVVSFIIAEKSMHMPVVGSVARALQSVPVVRAQDMKVKGIGTAGFASEVCATACWRRWTQVQAAYVRASNRKHA